jgi:hypothetical protein
VTDNPLDCIGLPLAARIGKHDFRLHPTATTNTLATPALMTTGTLARAMDMLRKHEQQSKQLPVEGRATQAFLDELKDSAATVPEGQVGGLLSLVGFPMRVVEDLPPGVLAEFRNADGEVVGQIKA